VSFDDFAVLPGRLPATILELDLDSCENLYGSAPCAATLARTNIIRESRTFDVGAVWAPFNSVVSPNAQVAPDGTTTADALTPDNFAISEVKELTQPLNLILLDLVSSFAVACFFKQTAISPTNARVFMRTNGVDGAFVDVNLDNGMVIDSGNLNTGAPLVSSAVSQPGLIASPPPGWFRVILVFKLASLVLPQMRFALIDKVTGNASFVGVPGGGFYMWEASMRPGESPGIFATTTAAILDGMGTVDDICFNTFGTCQDPANYAKEVKTYRYIDTISTPIEISDAYPAISENGVKFTPTRLQPGGDLSIRGKVTVRLQDFTDPDAGGPKAASGNVVDKYNRLRTYDPESRGTHFGKLKARNEFYVGRPMRVLEGYMDEPFSLANFRTREYIIEEIRGPGPRGEVEIVGKDVLSLAINTRAKAPTPSVGTLAAAMTAVQTTLTVGAGEGVAYDVDVNVRVDDEIMTVASRAADVLTVTRGDGGTTAEEHDAGQAVQSCLTYVDEPVINVIQTLLENFSSVPPAFIPFVDWQAEEAASLAGYDVTTIISEPTGVTQLLKEIMEVTLIDLWYDDVAQEIKLKLETPFSTVIGTIDDESVILQNTLKTKDDQNRRLSRVLIWYGIRNFAQDLSEASNYGLANFDIEADKESVNKFNDERVKVIFSRWFDASNDTQVQLTSQRLLARFGRVPVELSFSVDAKDVNTFNTGDVIDIKSRIIQDPTGANKVDRFQIIESRPHFPASQYAYTALAFFIDPISQGPLVINVNRTDLDLFVEFGGPPTPVEVTVTINAGVIVDASKGNAAITTGALHPDSIITIVNSGTIRGHSGVGGDGGDAQITCVSLPEFPPPGDLLFLTFTGDGDPGQAGGDAVNQTIDEMFIDNTALGNIFGGGGGGGGGGSRTFPLAPGRAAGGGGGGGGRGSDGVGCAGAGGVATSFTDFGCPVPDLANGSVGTDGSEVGAGAGGAGGSAGGNAGAAGSAGADWAEVGTVGVAAGSLGGAGGVGGFAVRKNGGTLTFLGGNNPTQVKGSVA